MSTGQETTSGPRLRQFPGLVVLGLAGTCCSGKSTVAANLEKLGALNIEVDRLGHQALVDEADRVVEAFGRQILSDPADPASPIERKKLGALVFGHPDRLKLLESIVHPAMVRKVEALILQAESAYGHKQTAQLRDQTAQYRGNGRPGQSGERPVQHQPGTHSSDYPSRLILPAASNQAGPSPAGPSANPVSPDSPRLPLYGLVVVNAALLFPMGLDRLCDLCVFVDAPFLVRLGRALDRDHLGLRATLKRLCSQRGLFPKNPHGGADISIIKSRTSGQTLEAVRKALIPWRLSWPEGRVGDEQGSR